MGGDAILGNPSNIQESEDDMRSHIQTIELVKHNPQFFWLNFWDFNNHFEIVGGFRTLGIAAIGASLSYSLFTRRYAALGGSNAYHLIHQGVGRILFGGAIGGAFGYAKFGDRQRLHNAWIAERLRRRYPEAKTLSQGVLWSFKGVPATHEFYRWR